MKNQKDIKTEKKMTKGDVVSTTNDVDAVVSYKKEAEHRDQEAQYNIDTCKADIYKPTSYSISKMAKMMSQGNKIAPYQVDYGSYPFGHGEKSVILLLQNGLKLTNDEMLAIRWHMSAWDLPFQFYELIGNINKAKQICPLVTLIQTADGLASHILEND